MTTDVRSTMRLHIGTRSALRNQQKNALLKIALIFLPVVVVIIAISLPSFAAQSDFAPKAGSSSEKEAVGEDKVGLFLVR